MPLWPQLHLFFLSDKLVSHVSSLFWHSHTSPYFVSNAWVYRQILYQIQPSLFHAFLILSLISLNRYIPDVIISYLMEEMMCFLSLWRRLHCICSGLNLLKPTIFRCSAVVITFHHNDLLQIFWSLMAFPINVSCNMILYCNNFGRFNNNYNVPEIIQILGIPKIYILSTHLQYKANVSAVLTHFRSFLINSIGLRFYNITDDFFFFCMLATPWCSDASPTHVSSTRPWGHAVPFLHQTRALVALLK